MHQHPGEEGVGPCTLFYVVWCGVKFIDIEALWTGGDFYVAYNFITYPRTTQGADTGGSRPPLCLSEDGTNGK